MRLDPRSSHPVRAHGRVSLDVRRTQRAVPNFTSSRLRAPIPQAQLRNAGHGTCPIATEVFNPRPGELNPLPSRRGPSLKPFWRRDRIDSPPASPAQAKAASCQIAIAWRSATDFPTCRRSRERIHGVAGPHFGFYTTAGAPREAIERLNREVIRVMQEPVVRDRFRALAVDLAEPMTPEQFAAYVRGEHERYSRLIPELGIK